MGREAARGGAGLKALFSVMRIGRRRPNVPMYSPPNPFPGKYPTRIYWSIRYKGNTRDWYIGKPSRIAILRFKKLMLLNAKRVERIIAVEFDRTQWVWQMEPGRADNGHWQMGGRTDTWLWMLYHPWMDMDGMEWVLRPWWKKEIKTKLGMMKIYSRFEELQPVLHVRAYQDTVAQVKMPKRKTGLRKAIPREMVARIRRLHGA